MFGLSIKNFYYLLNLSFVLFYVLYYANFSDKTHKYLDILNEIYAIFVGIVLMYYFNPYHKEKLNKFHKKLAFSAGILIILTSSISALIKEVPLLMNIQRLIKIIRLI